MKSALLATLLLTAVSAHAQMQPPPPTKTEQGIASAVVHQTNNTVLVTTTDSLKAAYTTIRQTLLAKGYALASSDAELLAFTSTAKAVGKNRLLTVTGFVTRMPSGQIEIALRGSYSYATSTLSGNVTQLTRPVAWQGDAFGSDSAIFKMLMELGEAYPRKSSPLTYATR